MILGVRREETREAGGAVGKVLEAVQGRGPVGPSPSAL